jgi:hypothetical protein
VDQYPQPEGKMADTPQIKVKRAEPINYAPLNAIDNAFLLFEEDYHPMTIGNIWEIDRPMTFEEVIEATRPLMERMEYRYDAMLFLIVRWKLSQLHIRS